MTMLEELAGRLEELEFSYGWSDDKRTIELDDVNFSPYQGHLLVSCTICRAIDDFEIYEEEVFDVDHAIDMIDYLRKELLA